MRYEVEITIRTTGTVTIDADSEAEARSAINDSFGSDVDIEGVHPSVPDSRDAVEKLYTPLPESISARYRR